MKKLHILLNLAVLLLLWSACKPSCPDPGNQVNYVDKTYLPDIIPYSDTSTARLLKNGKDTLLFRSQGLKESFVGGSTLDSDCPKNYSSQQLSLTMKSSDTDYFEIKYISISDIKLKSNGVSFLNLLWNKGNIYDQNKSFSSVFLQEITVLGTSYNSVTKITTTNEADYFINKNKVGIVKMSIGKNLYELIK